MRATVADTFRRVAFQRSFRRRPCAHLAGVEDRTSTAQACPGCEEGGGPWVHLRMCLSCGSIGCCDSSKQQHARAHFEATGHPIIRSIEPGEAWGWCYVDRAYLAPLPRGVS
jgi:CPA2 family monovalent cation:H+ antiporter-2